MNTVLSETPGVLTIPTQQRFYPQKAFEVRFPHGDHRNCGLLIFDYDQPGSDEDAPVHMTPEFREHVLASADKEVCLPENVRMTKAKVLTSNPYTLENVIEPFFSANEVLALLMHLLILPRTETPLEIGKSSMTSTWNVFFIKNKEGVPCAVVVEWNSFRDQYYLDAFPVTKRISGIFNKIVIFARK